MKLTAAILVALKLIDSCHVYLSFSYYLKFTPPINSCHMSLPLPKLKPILRLEDRWESAGRCQNFVPAATMSLPAATYLHVHLSHACLSAQAQGGSNFGKAQESRRFFLFCKMRRNRSLTASLRNTHGRVMLLECKETCIRHLALVHCKLTDYEHGDGDG